VISRGDVVVPFYTDQEKDKELYRQSMIGVHIPRLMLDEVKSFFEERSKR